MAKRYYCLDNLKVALTLLVIFHHAGQAYGNGGAWPYAPSNPAEVMPWIWHFFSTNAAFFMGLFFLISGYFVPMSYDRQGAKSFVKKKLLRLGVPLLLMGEVFSLLFGRVEMGHLWFVESLLLFSLLYMGFRRLVHPCPTLGGNRSPQPSLLGMTVVALLMGVGSYHIRQVSPQDHWLNVCLLSFEPAHYLQYAMMFALGVLAYRFRWLDRLGNRTGFSALCLGLLFALGNCLREDNLWGTFVERWFGYYESFLCVFVSVGLLWLFREYGNGSSRFLRWCPAQSYGAYIFHLPLMLGVQFLFDGVWMGALGKFLFVGTASTLLSFFLTWLLRRKIVKTIL